MRIDVQGTYGIAVQIYVPAGNPRMIMVHSESWGTQWGSIRVYLGWV